MYFYNSISERSFVCRFWKEFLLPTFIVGFFGGFPFDLRLMFLSLRLFLYNSHFRASECDDLGD